MSQPGDRPLRFALLCHQRSGSNALSSLLQQHPDVAMYGQLFNDGLEYRRYHRNTLDLPLFRPHPRSALHHGPRPSLRRRLEQLALRFVQRADDVEQYAEAFFTRYPAARAPGASAVGCKVHDLQLVEDDLRTFVAGLDRIVVLTRDNLLRAAVSWAVAEHSDVWVQHGPGRRRGPSAEQPVSLDPGELRWFITKTAAAIDGWRRVVADAGTPALWLTYEDHVRTRDLDRLWAHLELDPIDAPFTTRKLARGYDHVANVGEIDALLGSPATGRLREV